MREEEEIQLLPDGQLENVVGGSTKAYRAAVSLMNGEYGSGADCRQAVSDLGLDYWRVRAMCLPHGEESHRHALTYGSAGDQCPDEFRPERVGREPCRCDG